MSYYSKIVIAMVGILFFLCSARAGEKIRVTFINPSYSTNDFWGTTMKIMQAAANDLDMEVTIYHANINRYNHTKFAMQEAGAAAKPDYFITMYVRQETRNVLNIMEKAAIKTFIINTDILPEDKEELGRPREKYKYWIGHMFPDDTRAGYDLADMLIRTAQDKHLQNKNGEIEIIGISGKHQAPAALSRNQGLRQAVRDHGQNLRQILFADWSRELAAKKSLWLMKNRYPDVSVFWAASDLMSLGIIESIRKAAKIPGQQVVTGGVDWMPDAFTAIQSGQMTATVGGQFLEGGWVMVMLHDYHHGIDFAKKEGVQIRTKMGLIHKGNVQDYLKRFGTRNWDQIDFKRLSKVHNPDLKTYDFSLDAIAGQLHP